MKIAVFVDSDVVISSIISKLGAAYLLMAENYRIEKFVSNRSLLEIWKVVERLKLEKSETEIALKNFKLIKNRNLAKYRKYIFDDFDAPIIDGAVEAKVRFLLTYNLKHYNAEMIKRDLKILVMTPGKFLQYLRSLE